MHKITDLCSQYPFTKERLESYPWLMESPEDKKRVHIIGLGDVGQNAAISLKIAGADTISQIGIYDLDEQLLSRMEIELSQILSPLGQVDYPKIRILDPENLFDCDIVLFCATAFVPAVGEEAKGDVRMAQFAKNVRIIREYARQASKANYKGLFGVVSDPLDLLCGEVARFLHPEQVQGFGLGVMFARADYYASKRSSKDPRFSHFRLSGRVYGPHGNGLVAVNSISPQYYDDRATEKLTNLTVGANISVRALGYKPYIAPGVSSVGLTIPEVIKGNWNDSARCLNGVFFGARNKITSSGTKWEKEPLPDELYYRLRESYRALDKALFEIAHPKE